MNAVRMLVIDSSESTSELLAMDLREDGIKLQTERADSRAGIEEALQWFEPDLVLSRFGLPELDGMQTLGLVHRIRPAVPFIFVADARVEPQELAALRQGALDYVPRSDRVRLLAAVRHALNEAFERRVRREAERALQESEIRFRLFMEHMPGAVYMKDLDGKFTYVNTVAKRMIGRPAGEILGRTLEQLYPADVAAVLAENDQRALKVRQAVEALEDTMTPDGPRTFQSVKFPVIGVDGLPTMVGGWSVDVTQRLFEQRQIARLNRMHAVLSGINSAILRIEDRDTLLSDACRIAVTEGGFRMAWIGLADPGQHKVTPVAWYGADDGYLDEVGRLLEASGEERQLTGWSVHVGSWDAGVSAEAVRQSEAIVCENIETDPRVVFKEPALARGFRSLVALPLNVKGKTVGTMTLFAGEARGCDADELALLGSLAENISFALDHLSKAQQLTFVSWYDPLTGLPNRALFVDRLSQMLRDDASARRGVSLLLFDLKRFREINALLGRDSGDQVLKVFATRLTSAFGRAATVGRIAGDQFAVAVSDMNISTLATLGDDRWDGRLVAPMLIDGTEVRAPFKLGISSRSPDGDSAELLFRQAEVALQRAKEAGDVCVFYAPEMNSLAARHLRMESLLRKAVDAKQFVLHYQVKVDLATRNTVGVEALLRWRDPERGLVPPEDFLPVLESSGLIVDVGRWAIEQAVSDMRWWHTCGLNVPRVSVNISWVEIRQADFVGKVLAAVGGPLNAAEHLDLEITEGGAMEDMAAAGEKLTQLHDLGVGIVMDDFGTGASSLGQLALLPVDVVKIDRSLVVDMDEQPKALAIVAAVVGLAKALGIVALAEGIESETVARHLYALGCQQGQGFHFSPPMSAVELATWLLPTVSTDVELAR